MRPERFPYGRHGSQYAELFRPAGDGPHPVAVVIHGGFWKATYGRKLMHPLCRDLAARGWAAWNLEYRRIGPFAGGGYPMTLDDVAAGIDALADAPELPRDGRVVAIGHSAGGHLAAWAATREDPAVALTAAVSQAGVVDLRTASALKLSGGVVHRLLGGTPEKRPERYAAASPVRLAPLGVPTLLVHGVNDATVTVEHSRRYAQVAGDEVELVELEDAIHRSFVDPRTPAWEAAASWL